ncbi:MAG: DNA replication/repair protein RecF [Candidatus Schekmanbacteria bacterium]|nr:MAG: DNA replication/repair protein RecF [Candidatus Schekmanbacteria bacterium]
MWIENISIRNFRNIESADIQIGNCNLLIVGENSQGKTSVLEAIYLFSLFKSFRSSKRYDVISFGADFSHLKIRIGNRNGFVTCNAVIDKEAGISVKREGTLLKRRDIFNLLNVVVFHPGSINLIEGGPDKRRNFIDSVIVKCDPSYLKILKLYKRALLQRNALLKKSSVKERNSQLDVWENEISNYGAMIRKRRISYIREINELIADNFSRIFGRKADIRLTYCGFDESEESREDIRKEILKNLIERRQSDVRFGYTSYGPHRDVINVISEGQDMKKFSSRGEQRAAVFSLLEAEAERIKKERGEYPVFLVDDIAAEFDEEREKNFLKALVEKKMQIIATATDIPKEYMEIFRGKIIKITGGKCTSI